jgi:hypothetical protein
MLTIVEIYSVKPEGRRSCVAVQVTPPPPHHHHKHNTPHSNELFPKGCVAAQAVAAYFDATANELVYAVRPPPPPWAQTRAFRHSPSFILVHVENHYSCNE